MDNLNAGVRFGKWDEAYLSFAFSFGETKESKARGTQNEER
jgi:hypothetical protein